MKPLYVLSQVFLGMMLFLGHSSALASNLLSQKEVGERVAAFTKSFLGSPYKLSPLGEGRGIDPDPLIRFDEFDCTTFVETVGAMALTKSNNVEEVLNKLNQIRYFRGIPSFFLRNHFISVDWLPHNEENKNVQDLTASLFPNDFKTVHTMIDKTSWFKQSFGIILDKPEPVVDASLNVIYIEDFLNNPEMAEKIPQGAIISFVRNNPTFKNRIGTDLEVGHLAFAIWKDGELYIRHAKGKQFGVVEEKFDDLLRSNFIPDKYAFNVSIFVDQGTN